MTQTAVKLGELQQTIHRPAGAGANAPAMLASSEGKLTPEIIHAMEERDDQLVRDLVLRGHIAEEYIYEFSTGGKKVRGVSVNGAQELASHYRGITSRVVTSTEKNGDLIIFRTFDPAGIQVQCVPQLADRPDWYDVTLEVTDTKTGNSVQVRKSESAVGADRFGKEYDRPHFATIADSKAYRNGVLRLVPRSVVNEFKKLCIQAKTVVQEKTLPERQAELTRYAARFGVSVDRQSINKLTFDEVSGLSDAAMEGGDAFKQALTGLGLASMSDVAETSAEADPADQASHQPNDPPPAAEEAEQPQDTTNQPTTSADDDDDAFNVGD